MTSQANNYDITILMMIYNHEEWIEDTLNSLLDQTYQNFNLLLIDDVSSDRSYEIARSMAPQFRNCTVLKNENNKGAVGNFFYALNLIESLYPCTSFFLWASPDDTWSPKYLEAVRSGLTCNPGAVVCQTGYEMIHVGFNERTQHTLPSIKISTYDSAKNLFLSHGKGNRKARYNCIIQGLIRFSDLRYIFPADKKLLDSVLCIEMSVLVALFLRGQIEMVDAIYYHRKKLGKFEDKYPEDPFAQGRASLSHRIKAVCRCLPWLLKINKSPKHLTFIPLLWLKLCSHYVLRVFLSRAKLRLKSFFPR